MACVGLLVYTSARSIVADASEGTSAPVRASATAEFVASELSPVQHRRADSNSKKSRADGKPRKSRADGKPRKSRVDGKPKKQVKAAKRKKQRKADRRRSPIAKDDGRLSSERRLTMVERITGKINPKSVVSSQTGLFFAQNMMYRHSITVYDRNFKLVRTIDDSVQLAKHGYGRFPGTVRGAPVEAAVTPSGDAVYVSNYSMYGPGFGPAGDDVCSPNSGIHDSFVYRIDTRRLRITDAIRVGAVPKFLAVTADASRVLVSNWCSYDLSVINTKKAREVKRLPLGRYPRGIAIDRDSKFAYVALMGTRDIARVNLDSYRVRWIRDVGSSPRHLVLGPGGNFLYASLSGEGAVAKVHVKSGRVVDKVTTGAAPRTMVIAEDGRSLYVVNYESNTLSKIQTMGMRVVQSLPTASRPIGVTYDTATRQVWVAEYRGSIAIFRDR